MSKLARFIVLASVLMVGFIAAVGIVDVSDDVKAVATIVFVLGFIAFSFKSAGGLAKSFAGGDLLETGEPAVAVITAMSETGTTVNQHPYVAFDLRVSRTGSAPYDTSTKQILPRLMLGQVRPGLQVGVKVDPADASSVAIDWSTLADAGPNVPPATATRSARDFLAGSIRAMGEIDEMRETDVIRPNPETGAEWPVFAFTVTVDRDGREPYQAPLLQGVPVHLVGRFGPGARVPIGISPDDDNEIAIDWDDFEKQR